MRPRPVLVHATFWLFTRLPAKPYATVTGEHFTNRTYLIAALWNVLLEIPGEGTDLLHEVLSSTRAVFSHFQTLPMGCPRKFTQSSKLTRFVYIPKFHSLISTVCSEMCKKTLYWRTGPSPFSDEIHITFLMVFVNLTLCKIYLRRFWLNFRIQKENK